MSSHDELETCHARCESAPRVALLNLGCRVNRVELDLFARSFERAGCAITNPADADLVIVNTCAVTGEAQAKTRKAVRRATQLPQAPMVIATGCVATLFSDELREAAPGVVIEPDKTQVAARGLEALGRGLDYVADDGQLAMSPTPTGRTRPGIKIQDGCNNRCSFCIVWKARGASRSLSVAQIVAAVREACDRGAHEVVLTGINLGSFRADDAVLAHGTRLDGLLDYLLENTGIDRIRLSSIEPPDVTDELLTTMANSGGRIAPFLHVCLQSGCDATLRHMRRVYDTGQFRNLVTRARDLMPRIALGTDLIVGFPGETDAEFEESLAFCKEMAFARMHVFRYSKRPGTPAAVAKGQVPPPVSAQRSARMRTLAQAMQRAHLSLCDGVEDYVVVQDPGVAIDSYLHEVRVDPRLAMGAWERVRLELCESGIVGRLVKGRTL